MNERREFARDSRGYVLMGDARDIGVATRLRNEVITWCDDNDIVFLFQGNMAGTDVWRVRDEQQRVMFILKWA